MREASRAGAIGIEWDRRAGEDGQIVGITLRSAEALGALLGHSTTTSKIAAARSALAEWAAHPNVAALMQAWMTGRSPRGVSVECVQDVVDTMKLVKECADNQYQDVSERRVSARLFGDSKRIEQLSTVIDLMTAQTFDEAEPRTQIAVLSDLGLLKHPQAMLVSGRLELWVGRDNRCAARLSVTFPYVGVAPLHVYAALGSPTYVLSVENLTIFNELANEAAGPLTGVLIYTGGYPSPAMLRAYKVILESFDVPTCIGETRISADSGSQTCSRRQRSRWIVRCNSGRWPFMCTASLSVSCHPEKSRASVRSAIDGLGTTVAGCANTTDAN
jgi:hypothetical protein